MALTPQDVSRIANLARLELSEAEQASLLGELNGFFDIVERMRAVDTTGVAPLYTPLSAVQDVVLRLREDALGLAQFINASGGGKQFQRDDLYREKGTELLRDIGPTLGETLGLLDSSRHHFDDIKAKLDGLSCDR